MSEGTSQYLWIVGPYVSGCQHAMVSRASHDWNDRPAREFYSLAKKLQPRDAMLHCCAVLFCLTGMLCSAQQPGSSRDRDAPFSGRLLLQWLSTGVAASPSRMMPMSDAGASDFMN